MNSHIPGILAVPALLFLSGCGDQGVEPSSACTVERLVVSPELGSVYERVGELALTAALKGAHCGSEDISWTIAPLDAGSFAGHVATAQGFQVKVRAERTGADLTVTAHAGSVTASATVTVLPAPVASITFQPLQVPIVLGTTRPVQVRLFDATHTELTGRTVTWVSSDPTRFTVSSAGLVTGLANGSAQLRVVAGIAASTTVEVLRPGTIIYSSGPYFDPEPYEAVDADGTSRRMVTYQAGLSPDSSRLAHFGTETFSVENLSTGTRDSFPSLPEVGQVVWSPDGSRLLAIRSSSTGGEIFLVTLDGNPPRQLTSNAGAQPSWSPDGSRVVYAFGIGVEPSGIAIMDADGTNQVVLGKGNADLINHPRWSPDGRTILYRSVTVISPDLKAAELWSVAVNGGGRGRISTTGCSRFIWSSDGSRILCVADPPRSFGPSVMYSMNSDGSGLVKLMDVEHVTPLSYTIH